MTGLYPCLKEMWGIRIKLACRNHLWLENSLNILSWSFKPRIVELESEVIEFSLQAYGTQVGGLRNLFRVMEVMLIWVWICDLGATFVFAISMEFLI